MQPLSIFKFSLGQQLAITCSAESGECIARSEHLLTDPQYLIRYKAADGRATEAWWAEHALADATPVMVIECAPSAPPPIGNHWHAQGGIYAGMARGVDGAADHHLILSHEAPAGTLNWQAAQDWAKALADGGFTDWVIPTRPESALLFANLRNHIDPVWHWTSEQSSRDNAWYQTFDDGFQSSNGKSSTGRARAVRRLIIQSLSHS